MSRLQNPSRGILSPYFKREPSCPFTFMAGSRTESAWLLELAWFKRVSVWSIAIILARSERIHFDWGKKSAPGGEEHACERFDFVHRTRHGSFIERGNGW
jgi:hypothetical protein